MGRNERCAIVGAGIIGCATAFELARRGCDVTVFDARGAGGGATHASAGILAPYTEAHGGGSLFDLTVRGLAVYDEFVGRVRAESSVAFEYRRAGTIEVAFDARHASELRARLDRSWAAEAGLEWLAPEMLRAEAPGLHAAAVGGLLCRAHGHVAVPAFTHALVDAARSCGCHVVTGVSAERIEPSAGVILVRTQRGIEAFDRVILCAGAWTPALDPFGRTTGRITPVRGQLLRLQTAPATLRRVLWSQSCYLVPWQDGTVLVGATSEEAGFEERATAGGVHELLTAAADLVPALRSATFLDVQVGLRPAGVGGFPILGPAPDPRILYAAGHYRNGVLLAPLTAHLIAEYVFTNTVDPAFSAA